MAVTLSYQNLNNRADFLPMTTTHLVVMYDNPQQPAWGTVAVYVDGYGLTDAEVNSIVRHQFQGVISVDPL